MHEKYCYTDGDDENDEQPTPEVEEGVGDEMGTRIGDGSDAIVEETTL